MNKSRTPSLYELNEQSMYQTMVRALTALHRARPSPEYVAIACLITCYIDAIAANGGEATTGKFERFLRKNFGQLCSGLRRETGRDGAQVFRTQYRTKMTHNFFTPDPRFALAEDAELQGKYAGPLVVGDRTLVAINIERLYRDFVSFARSHARRRVKLKKPRQAASARAGRRR